MYNSVFVCVLHCSIHRALEGKCFNVLYTTTIRYDTIEEINVDSKAEYTA